MSAAPALSLAATTCPAGSSPTHPLRSRQFHRKTTEPPSQLLPHGSGPHDAASPSRYNQLVVKHAVVFVFFAALLFCPSLRAQDSPASGRPAVDPTMAG